MYAYAKDDPVIIVALDFPNARRAIKFAQKLDPRHCRVKVGMELFTVAGPSIVKRLVKLGFDVFLDLKFKDIPATVAKAVLSACRMRVWMLNLHADGAAEMMEGVASVLERVPKRPLVIAVTVLTSMDAGDLRQVGVSVRAKKSTRKQVLRLAELAQLSEMDGVVASGQEARDIRHECGEGFLIVTPAVRLPGGKKNDQKRIVTPRKAILAGANYLVVGRPITETRDPVAALEEFNQHVRDARAECN